MLKAGLFRSSKDIYLNEVINGALGLKKVIGDSFLKKSVPNRGLWLPIGEAHKRKEFLNHTFLVAVMFGNAKTGMKPEINYFKREL